MKPQIKIFPEWIRSYHKDWLRLDILAGIITAAIVIPKAMAYATIAGLPVQVGLYTALIPMAIYAFTGTSSVLSVSSTTTLAILSAAELALVVPNGELGALLTASVTLTLLVGAILAVAALLRFGFVANFISEPVLVGFKAGIAMVIVLDQVPKLFGIHFEKGGFIFNLVATFEHISMVHLPTLIVSICMIVLLVGIEKLVPKLPAPLIVILGGIGASVILGLENKGVELVGHIPKGLPALVAPDISLIGALWPGAMGIALMSFTETIAAARAFSKSGEPRLVPNRELMATGLANMGGSVLGAMPAGGGTSQTAMNRLTGAKTQVSTLVTAVMSLMTMLFLAPYLGLMPQATLAAVVIVYSIGLFVPADFKSILKIRKTEFIWALIALAGVILLGTLQGIMIAILVSMVALAYQAADPPLHILGRKPGTNVFRAKSKEYPEDEEFPGLLIIRPEGRVFFANAARIGDKIRPMIEEMKPRVVILELSGVFDLEYTALKMLVEAESRMREEGVELWLVDLNPAVFKMINRSALSHLVKGDKRMFFSLEIALDKFISQNKLVNT